jgi:putative DNA primase/helicase
MNKNLEYALKYAELGWASFAVNGKKPIGRSWTKECTTQKEELERLFAKNPSRGIGIATEPSELFVLDIDRKSNGYQSLEALEDQHGKLPETLVAETGGGGLHYYFKRPPGGIKSTTGTIAQGIDSKCNGGYIVAAPSPHETGNEYCWRDDEPDEIELAEVPEWVLELIRGRVANVIPINRGRQQQNGWRGNTDVNHGSRNDSMIQFVGLLIQVGGTIQSIHTKAQRANRVHLKPPLPQDELTKMLNSAIERWTPLEARQQGIIRPLGYYQNHSYRARHFHQKFGEIVKYIPEQKVWASWIGSHWHVKPETEEAIVRPQIFKLNQQLWDATIGMANPLRDAWQKWAKKCEDAANILSVIKLAKSFMQEKFEAFNKDDYLFSCANGVINLKTGELLEHSPKFLLTQTSKVNFDASGECPEFLKFLNDITDGDEKLQHYLQKLVGYCLSGSISERIVFIFYGFGKNGKSTFLRVLAYLMGDYYKATSALTFTSKSDDPMKTDLATIHDARLVTTSEMGKNGRLDSTVIKMITGGDEITCRFLFRGFFTYLPKYKLVMAVNERPNLSQKDQATWDRIHEVPFKVRISDDKNIAQEQLLSTFNSELSGILNWAIEGFMKWQSEGLEKPESVAEATNEYKTDVDPISLWIGTRYTGNQSDTVPTRLLFDDFIKFARDNDLQFGETFDDRQFGKKIMHKYKSKAKKVDGSIAKHYFGFKLPN